MLFVSILFVASSWGMVFPNQGSSLELGYVWQVPLPDTRVPPYICRSLRANFPPVLVLEGKVASSRTFKNLYVVKLFEQWFLFKVRTMGSQIHRECEEGLHVAFS